NYLRLSNKGGNYGSALTDDRVGPQTNQLSCERLDSIRISSAPAIVDPNVAALRPPKLLESLPECGDEDLLFPVALHQPHQHTDPAHYVELLRARRERPSNCGASNNFDEIAALHVPP